jgi:hypothetical protein
MDKFEKWDCFPAVRSGSFKTWERPIDGENMAPITQRKQSDEEGQESENIE